MLPDPRSLVLFGTNALLFYLTLLVNHALAAWSIHLVLLGPMIVLPALYLRHGSFFLTTLLTGLWVDAALPTVFGLFTLTFLTLGTLVFMLRIRFRPEHNYHPVLIGHAVNLGCLAALAVATVLGGGTLPAFLPQVALTSALSHLALGFVSPWFHNLQRLLFALCQLDTEPEDFPMT